MPSARPAGGGGGGSAYGLGPAPNTFAGDTARDAQASDADWLAQYNANRSFWIRTGTTIQRRNAAGDGWEDVTAVVQGPAGRDGTDGEDGVDGAPGRDGANGAPGRDGTDGAPGMDGAPGRDGVDGADGADGAPGRDGTDGIDGADGTQVSVNPSGTDGSTATRLRVDGVNWNLGGGSGNGAGLSDDAPAALAATAAAGTGNEASRDDHVHPLPTELPARNVLSGLANPPATPGTAEAWIQYLAGQRAVLDKAVRDVQAAIDALEQTAPRDATHDWQTLPTHLAAWGGLGFAWSTAAWATVDAETENFTTEIYNHADSGITGLYVLLQLPRTLDIERFRLALTRGNNITVFPNAFTEWVPFGGTVENATGTDRYYVIEIDNSDIQFLIGLQTGDTVQLQQDHGTPASVWIPDGSVTAAMLDADNATKQEAFRTAIGAGQGGGGGALTDDSVEPRHLDADTAQKQAAMRARIGLVTTQGHTIADDTILPDWLRADSAAHKEEFRERINAKVEPDTIMIAVGWADTATGASPDDTADITVPVNERFLYRGGRTDKGDHRFLVMPSSSYRPVSIIGEGGETIDEWERQTDERTWSIGPLSGAGRDPETFYILLEPTGV